MNIPELEDVKSVINGDYILIPIETGYIKPNDTLDCIIKPARELMQETTSDRRYHRPEWQSHWGPRSYRCPPDRPPAVWPWS